MKVYTCLCRKGCKAKVKKGNMCEEGTRRKYGTLWSRRLLLPTKEALELTRESDSTF